MAWIAGRFGTVEAPASATLAVGETLTVTGSVVLTGGTNNNSQFRFGLFDDGGKFALDDGSNWTGGWLHSIGTVETSDLWQGRTDGPFISTAGDAVNLDSVKTLTGLFDGDSVEPFTFLMSITRDSETTIDIISLIEGGDGELSEGFDREDIETSQFTYTSMGWLFGGSSAVEEVVFSDVEYSVTRGEETPLSLEIRSDGVISELDYKVGDAELYNLESSLDLINWNLTIRSLELEPLLTISAPVLKPRYRCRCITACEKMNNYSLYHPTLYPPVWTS
ncbi:hypothetical protein N9904_01245 [Akkermansiaceae bacterium]|nr:hypothetical protein [Akkermansiaceae bacterium]MDB4326110.1 hypothetical protein [bacterium]MDB4296598.1 hypothetical protein [Akkermansiaceae bacterium]MDB4313056.1 hypothetical protein [Akkermansiaceae bacterium]MDB4328144.1 hypothetical protein [Akkermansiaceae bacterium]